MARTIKIAIVILISIILLLLAGVGIYIGSDVLFGSLKSERSITVPDGYNTNQIAILLEQSGAISNSLFFKVHSKLSGFDGKWQRGTYILKMGQGYNDLSTLLTTPKTASIKATIPEGLQIKEIAAIYDRLGICTKDSFITTCNNVTFDYAFLAGTYKPGRTKLEGYLFPDTYYYEANTDPSIIIKDMLSNFGNKLYTTENKNLVTNTIYTFDEILTLASIVESEAFLESDRKLIADVFLKRLAQRASFPTMQSCVTVEYGMGIKKPIISLEDTKFESPYNTYKYPGLPIGPICNPSIMSFNAVLYPTPNNYYYFQSDKNSKIHYAATFQDHKAIQNQVQASWNPTPIPTITP